jgi:hypothetical protein
MRLRTVTPIAVINFEVTSLTEEDLRKQLLCLFCFS